MLGDSIGSSGDYELEEVFDVLSDLAREGAIAFGVFQQVLAKEPDVVHYLDENGASILHRVAEFCDYGLFIQLLLDAGMEPDEPDDNGMTPLHLAVWKNGTLSVIRTLVNAGADPDAITYVGSITPLMLACVNTPAKKTTRIQVIRTLLDAAADLEAMDEDGMTPYLSAARSSDDPLVLRTLLEAGANAQATDRYGFSAEQHVLARAFATDAMRDEFLDMIRNPDNYRNPAQQTSLKPDRLALSLAFDNLIAEARQSDSTDTSLFRYELNLNPGLARHTDEGGTLLHAIATHSSRAELVGILVAAGADVNAQVDDDTGYTALHIAAAFNDNPAMTLALIEAGANLESRENIFKATPLMYACAYRDDPIDQVTVIRALIRAGANIEARSDIGLTPYLYAVANTDHIEVLQTLIAAGADPLALDHNGRGAVQIAMEDSNVDTSAVIEFHRSITADM